MDTSTTNEIADGVKFNQEERAGAGHAFLLLRDYLKLAVGADFNLKSPFKAIKDVQKSLRARLIMLASHCSWAVIQIISYIM